MRDFQQEIDRCNDPAKLLQILDDLSAEVERANEQEQDYEDLLAQRRTHELELILRYGEDKLETLLS